MRRRTFADRFRWYWRLSNRLEVLQVRYTGTSGFGLIQRSPVLVLETTGRRSARRRRIPVVYWQDDGKIFIGGGAAGMTRVDWVANVRSRPEAVVWIKRRPISVLVHELDGEDYDAAKSYAFERWPNAAKYEKRSGRRIPYFRFDRLA